MMLAQQSLRTAFTRPGRGTACLLKTVVAAHSFRTTTAASASMSSNASQQNDANNHTTTAKDDSSSCSAVGVLPLDPKRVALIEEYGAQIRPLEPIGAAVTGIDLAKAPPPDPVIEALEEVMANRGFCVFKGQDHLSVDQLLNASEWWGGMELHSTHGVHPATPGRNPHIFRLSNDQRHGILGVGPQWHNDGSFVSGTFSHVGYHMIRVPEHGGGTHFCHQGAAYEHLSAEQQEYWERLSSVNSNSGVVHPLVHTHPVSKRKSVWLHLGMTGAVIEKLPNPPQQENNNDGFRLLDLFEMKKLMNDYNDLLNKGMTDGYAIAYEYEPGDCIFIDNLAVAHRASPEAHQSARQQGLRIMHRTTVRAVQDLKPHSGLPQYMDVYGRKPFDADASGVWIGGGIGFRWDEDIAMHN